MATKEISSNLRHLQELTSKMSTMGNGAGSPMINCLCLHPYSINTSMETQEHNACMMHDACNVPVTIQHILIDCPAHEEERKKIGRKAVFNLPNIIIFLEKMPLSLKSRNTYSR